MNGRAEEIVVPSQSLGLPSTQALNAEATRHWYNTKGRYLASIAIDSDEVLQEKLVTMQDTGIIQLYVIAPSSEPSTAVSAVELRESSLYSLRPST